ncbi:hypothetical protein WJX73_005757 [Symbiochloris irregularis]|uniref:SAP domain-containing protein n=1 Tax=Symbiochloris irregularis TaxID=706552 RepID=A0AAW1NUT0_9CHLO
MALYKVAAKFETSPAPQVPEEFNWEAADRVVKDPMALKLTELKDVARSLKVKMTGSKAEIIMRLLNAFGVDRPTHVPAKVLWYIAAEKSRPRAMQKQMQKAEQQRLFAAQTAQMGPAAGAPVTAAEAIHLNRNESRRMKLYNICGAGASSRGGSHSEMNHFLPAAPSAHNIALLLMQQLSLLPSQARIEWEILNQATFS